MIVAYNSVNTVLNISIRLVDISNLLVLVFCSFVLFFCSFFLEGGGLMWLYTLRVGFLFLYLVRKQIRYSRNFTKVDFCSLH